MPDEEGAELPDLDAAREFAVAGIRDLMADTLTHEGRITLDHSIDIKDGHGAVLTSVVFGDAVRIEDNRRPT